MSALAPYEHLGLRAITAGVVQPEGDHNDRHHTHPAS
jgi:hypothetical protein